MDETTLTDRATNSIQSARSTSQWVSNTTFSTPQQSNNFNNEINTQTVVKRARTRQQTVTVVESPTPNEVDAVFSLVQNIPNMDNPNEELKRQIQKLFSQKEAEWAFKLNETRESIGEELALCKIKLKSTQTVASKVDEFAKHLTANVPNLLLRQPSLNGGGSVGHGGGGESATNGMLTPHMANNHSGHTITADMMNELVTERDTLRDDYGQLENSYSDLFKRYEKMRENCVLLKNSEDELKSIVEEEAAKYERLLARFHELRQEAAAQLNQANLEIQRMAKHHEDNTLSLRYRLKMNDAQLQTQTKTIQGKDAEIGELKAMCEDLMLKKGIMDDDDGDEEDDDGVGDDSPNGDFVYR